MSLAVAVCCCSGPPILAGSAVEPNPSAVTGCTVCTSTTVRTLTARAILQHTPVILTMGLLSWQGHAYSFSVSRFGARVVLLLLKRLALSSFVVRLRSFLFRGLDRLGLLGLAWTGVPCRNHSHDLIAEVFEQSSLCGLRHVVAGHVPSGTPLDGQLILVDAIRYEVVANVDVLRSFAA